MYDNIQVLAHSAIRIESKQGKIIYLDPFSLNTWDTIHDADLICITHDHYDHFSPDDIARIMKESTLIVAPQSVTEKDSVRKQLTSLGFTNDRIISVVPGESLNLIGIPLEIVASYNIGKPFHPEKNKWVGYILTVNNQRIFVAGDTDANPSNSQISCDITLVPVGGTYTFTALEAACFVSLLKPQPQCAIPTHYGSITGTPEDGSTFISELKSLAPQITAFEKMQFISDSAK